jgi:AraC-like DNA-binding protein
MKRRGLQVGTGARQKAITRPLARKERTIESLPKKSCLAAPIFDAESGLLGFLDALPTHGELTGEASTLARTVMRTTARAIEERSFRKRYRREWIIALAPPDGGGCGILLAVDGQPRIVGADRHAGSTLSASNVNLGSGPTLWALFEKDAALFRDRNPGDIHAGLVAVGKRTNMDCDRHTTRTWRFDITTIRPRLESIGCFRRSAPPDYSAGGLAPRALLRIREYIEGHLGENIELETLAGIAGLSKWHFARAFKQSVGTPPHFYLIQRRLERAQELLAETDLSLAQIALKSGFGNQSHFSRRFRMFVGVTPRSFRRSKR